MKKTLHFYFAGVLMTALLALTLSCQEEKLQLPVDEQAEGMPSRFPQFDTLIKNKHTIDWQQAVSGHEPWLEKAKKDQKKKLKEYDVDL